MSEAPEKKEEEKPKRLLLFLGMRIARDGKRAYEYADVTFLPNEGEALPNDCVLNAWWSKPLFSSRPGSIHEAEVKLTDSGEVTSVYTKTGHYRGRWKDTEAVTRWQAADDALEDRLRLESTAKKEGARNFVYEALDPIRSAYNEAHATDKTLILARVLAYITRGQKT